jgi:hypothetical protein
MEKVILGAGEGYMFQTRVAKLANAGFILI